MRSSRALIFIDGAYFNGSFQRYRSGDHFILVIESTRAFDVGTSIAMVVTDDSINLDYRGHGLVLSVVQFPSIVVATLLEEDPPDMEAALHDLQSLSKNLS